MEHPLISAHGTLFGIAGAKHDVLVVNQPCDSLRSSLELRLEPEECNYHTSNTRDFSGREYEIDLPLYEYSPLPETGYIRLLTFAVNIADYGKWIVGSLTQHSFEEATKLGYEALSYAWGDPYRTHHISCVDVPGSRNAWKLPVTANLADWFRHCEVGRHVFWIDAICINQTDRVERASQVEQTREVYRNAASVVAWVGSIPGLDEAPYSLNTARDLAATTALASLERDIHATKLGLWQYLRSDQGQRRNLRQRFVDVLHYLRICCERVLGQVRNKYLLLRTYVDPSDFRGQVSGADVRHYITKRNICSALEHPVLTLFRRPYFARRWIVQELGSTPETLDILFQWDRFTFCSCMIMGTLLAEALSGNEDENQTAAFTKFMMLKSAHVGRHRHELPAIDFFLLAEVVQEFDCQDPRDRMFALVGLFPELKFKVDYTSAIEEVYTSFAAYLIYTQPRCLPTLLVYAMRHRSTLLPSWVPDWRVISENDGSKNPEHLEKRIIMNEAPQLPAECVEYIGVSDSSAKTLTAAGFFVGFIAGPRLCNKATTKEALYAVFTESRSFALLLVREDIFLHTGDLLFDLGNVFISRPTSSPCIEAQILVTPLRLSLKLFPYFPWFAYIAFNAAEFSTGEGPFSLLSIVKRAERELSRLRELSLSDDIFAWLIGSRHEMPGINETPGKIHFYGESVRFPRSRCLTVFDIV